MADTETLVLHLVKPDVGFSDDTWGGKQNDAFDLIDAVFLHDGTGTPVGIHIGPTDVAHVEGQLNVEGQLKVLDAKFTVFDAVDATKNFTFDATGVTAGTPAVFGVPPASDVLVGMAAAQKLTNKTATTEPITDNSEKLATTEFVNQILAAAGLTLFSTGDVKMTFNNVNIPGWLVMLDYTIGSAASGAAHANPNCEALFKMLWANVADAFCPVTPGGRGASAAADWTANKAIMLPKVLGRVLAGGGGFATGSGLSTRTLGQTVGEESHTLTVSEMPAHTHGGNFWGSGSPIGVLDSGSNNNTPLSTSGATLSKGDGGGHNNMQPTTFLNVMIKL